MIIAAAMQNPLSVQGGRVEAEIMKDVGVRPILHERVMSFKCGSINSTLYRVFFCYKAGEKQIMYKKSNLRERFLWVFTKDLCV